MRFIIAHGELFKVKAERPYRRLLHAIVKIGEKKRGKAKRRVK